MHEEPVAQNEVSLREYLDLLRRRKAIIISTFVAALFIGVAAILISRPVYRSTGRLLIAPTNPMMFGRDANNDPLGYLSNQRQMHNIQTQLEVLLTPKLIADAFIAVNLPPTDPRAKVSVDRINEDVDIIDVVSEAHNPAIAAGIANNLMNLYIAQDEDWRNGDIKTSIDYAKKEVKASMDRWNKDQIALTNYRSKEQITDFAGQIQSQTSMVAGLRTRRDQNQQDLDNLDKMLEVTQGQLAQLNPTIKRVSDATNLNIAKMREELMTVNADYQGALALYKPDHPKAIAVKTRLDTLDAALKKAPDTFKVTEVITNPEVREVEASIRKMQATQAGLFSQFATISAQHDQADKKLNNLSQRQSMLTRLMLASDHSQDHLKKIQDRLDELKLRDVAKTHPITVLNPARAEDEPVRPRKVIMIGMAAAAGLFLGVCFALLQEFLDDRINAPEDARRLLNVPALGYIPRIEKEDQRMLTSEKASGSLLESYRVLRSNVRFAAVGEPLNSIMVTSSAPGEGKSTTACNLAIAMALDGKRVILVDADLRRPTIHEKFGVRNTPGLTNVLVGALPLDKALQNTEVENLQILASGPIPPNPAELLNSSAMEQVQEMLKERCDIVIYDTPPCLSVADAQIMAATVDGLIYVVQVGSTRKSAIKHGNELLRQAHARILGVVYNKMQMDGKKDNYYYGYYSYYHKKELPSAKSNGNGKNGHSNEWDSLTAEGNKEKALAAGDAAEKE